MMSYAPKRDFFELVKAIGESKSKQEEDRIITDEVGDNCNIYIWYVCMMMLWLIKWWYRYTLVVLLIIEW